MVSNAQYKAMRKYRAKMLKQYIFAYNYKTDKEIIDKLDSVSNRADYVRQLILKDLKGGN